MTISGWFQWLLFLHWVGSTCAQWGGGEFSGGSFVEGLYKIAISRSAVIAQNAPQTIWRPGTARTPDGGAYSAPINHQRVWGPRKGREGWNAEGRKKVGREGKGKMVTLELMTLYRTVSRHRRIQELKFRGQGRVPKARAESRRRRRQG